MYDREQAIYGRKHFHDAVINEGAVYSSGIVTLSNQGYRITDDDRVAVVVWDTTALTADKTVALPSVYKNIGRELEFHMLATRGTYKGIIDAYGSETIQGFTTYELWDARTWVRLRATKNGWLRIGGTGSVMIPDSSRPDAWVLNAGSETDYTDVDFSSYAPSGTMRLLLKWSVMLVGDGALDSAYITVRRNGSAITDSDQLTRPSVFSQNHTNGLYFGGKGQIWVECDSGRIVEYAVGDATTDGYLNIEGYSYE